MRPISRTLILGLLLASASPALGQRWSPLDDFSERIGEAQADRLRAYRETRQQLIDGWCESRLNRLTSLHDTVERYQAQISEADLAAYRQALAQEWSYPCPPGGPPTPPQPPRQPPPFERTDAYRQWDPVDSQIALDLYDAEQATAAGDCQRRANRLRDAASRIDQLATEVSRQGPEFGNRFGGAGLDQYRARLAAELARPCPDPAAASKPPPQLVTPPVAESPPPASEQTIVTSSSGTPYDLGPIGPTSTRVPAMEPGSPAPPAQGITPQDEEAVRNQQASFDSVHMSASYGESAIPRANYGFVRDGPVGTAPERPAAFSEYRVPMLGIEVGGAFGGIHRFRLGYREGDASKSTVVEPSVTGGAQGVVGTDNAPSGSTGVSANEGLAATTEVSVEELYGGVDIPLLRLAPGNASDAQFARSGATILAGLDFIHRDRDHDGSVILSGVTGGGFEFHLNQLLEQHLHEFEAHGSLAAEFVQPLGSDARATFGARGGLYYFDFELESVEDRTQNFGPASDQAYTVTLGDGRDGIGFRGEAFAELAIELSPTLELFGSGAARYYSHRARLQNPSSGDFVLEGGTTFLTSEDAFDWQVAFGLRIMLGK